MQRARFIIPDLDEMSEAVDLGAVVLGISGVGDVSTDLTSHSISIEFDPGYVTADFLARTLKGAGYPAEGLGDPPEGQDTQRVAQGAPRPAPTSDASSDGTAG